MFYEIYLAVVFFKKILIRLYSLYSILIMPILKFLFFLYYHW